MIEVQLGQVALSILGREKCQFPNKTISNPKGQPNVQNPPKGQFGLKNNQGVSHDEVQAIHTLRLGKQVDNQVQMSEGKSEKVGKPNKENGQDDKDKEKEKHGQDLTKNPPVKPYTPEARYPQRI